MMSSLDEEGLSSLAGIMEDIDFSPKSLQHSLAVLMYLREWDHVRDILSKKDCIDTLETRCFGGEKGVNILHMMCRFQPPLDLVELTVNTWPTLVNERDPGGNFPLHVASLYGSRSDVVKYLLAVHKEAVMIPDDRGRLPLHLACRPIRWQPANQSDKNPQDTDRRESYNANEIYIHAGSAVIDALCQQYPHATNVEDCEGYNPLEIAIEQGLSKKICQLLLDASDKAWREYQAERAKDEDQIDLFIPGYTVAAAQELLKKCRSSYAQPSGSATNYEDRLQSSTCDSRKLPLINLPLPPYDQMLKLYEKQQALNKLKHLKESNQRHCQKRITNARPLIKHDRAESSSGELGESKNNLSHEDAEFNLKNVQTTDLKIDSSHVAQIHTLSRRMRYTQGIHKKNDEKSYTADKNSSTRISLQKHSNEDTKYHRRRGADMDKNRKNKIKGNRKVTNATLNVLEKNVPDNERKVREVSSKSSKRKNALEEMLSRENSLSINSSGASPRLDASKPQEIKCCPAVSMAATSSSMKFRTGRAA